MTLNDELAFKALQHRIDDPHNDSVVIILVEPSRVVHTAGIGQAVDPRQMFWLLHHVVTEQAEDLFASFTPQERAQAKIMLPTLEQAGDLGLLPFQRRKDR